MGGNQKGAAGQVIDPSMPRPDLGAECYLFGPVEFSPSPAVAGHIWVPIQEWHVMASDLSPTVLMLCLTEAMASLQSGAVHLYLRDVIEDRGLQRGGFKKRRPSTLLYTNFMPPTAMLRGSLL